MAGNQASGRETREACAGCGEETAVGSPLYSDRRQLELRDGTHAFVCSLCDQRVAASRRGKRMSDDELRHEVETGALAMISGNTAGRILRGF